MSTSLPLFLLLLLFSCACTTQDHSLSEKEIASIDSLLLMDVPEQAPGLAIGVVRGGQVVYENYAGYANLDDRVRIDERTRFNIASNGKQFTALAVLQLASNHRLDIDDDIRSYLPDILPDIGHKISLRHLLEHRSGIRDYSEIITMQGKRWWELNLTNGDVMQLMRQQRALNFEPGSQFMYSNSNYILLAEIISRVSGQSFENYTGSIFQKLKMEQTAFESDHTSIQGVLAAPYFNFNTWTTYEWRSDVVGDGALFTTLRDQLRWEQIIQSGRSYPLSADIIELSQKRQGDGELSSYGYGIEFGTYKGEDVVFHYGSTGAWKAVTYRFPEQQTAIVVLTNSGKVVPSMIVEGISDLLLGKIETDPGYRLRPERSGDYIEADDITGIYETDEGFIFRLELREGEVYLVRDGRNDTRLIRESANIFHQWNDTTFKQEFTRNKEGQMRVTAYHSSHAPYSLYKTEAVSEDYDPSLAEGSYVNQETNVDMKITYLGDEKYNIMISGRSYQAFLLSESEIKAGGYRIQLQKKNGTIQNLLLNGNRIKAVLFERQ